MMNFGPVLHDSVIEAYSVTKLAGKSNRKINKWLNKPNQSWLNQNIMFFPSNQ